MKTSILHDTAVLTVAYNSAEVLPDFITSATANGISPHNIVVIDNNSPDPEARRLAAQAGATVITLPENLGYGSAINAGFSQLPADIRYIVIANPDITFSPGAISELRHAFEKKHHGSLPVGAVGPQILNPDGTTYPSARNIPALSTGIGHALLGRIWPKNPWTRRYRQERADSAVARSVGWLSGALILTSRDVFHAVDGFDPGYFMYFEDVDLGYRLGQQGYQCLYWPAAKVVHSGAHSTAHSSAMIKAHHESAYRFLSKKYSGWYLAPVRWGIKIGLTLRSRVQSQP